MSKHLDSLEHDSAEERTTPLKRQKRDEPKPEIKMHSQRAEDKAADKQDQRDNIKASQGMDEDRPWMHDENPALWQGAI